MASTKKDALTPSRRIALRPARRSSPPRVFEPRFTHPGLVAALLFTALSLLPSLLPRIAPVQGLATGVTFVVGYGVGAIGGAVWRYLGIPEPHGRALAVAQLCAYGAAAFILAGAVWWFVGWQNAIRRSFGMEDLTPAVWPTVAGVALLVTALVLVAARSLRLLFRTAGNLLDRWLPRRLANVLAATALVAILNLLISGVLVQGFFGVANTVFSGRDTGDKPGVERPTAATKSGSPDSMVKWDDLGRQGRAFVGTGPSANDIDRFTGGGALDPIRVYVGLKSAETLQERSNLVLQELKRSGAFDRKVLVLATTTGTGWLDSSAVDSLEYLWNGDTAIAGVQYSYLPSWISLLADQDAVKLTTSTVFKTVYDYWSSLPEQGRPRLYLYGLSLGSFGVESVLGSVDIVNEPIDGALMVGPPFVNPMHADLVAGRDPGSPAWLPVVSNGRTVRFTTETNALGDPTAPWGPTRLVYLQHGSDPVVFFSPDLAWSEPDWLQPGQRAPDVSGRMTWFPLVTLWQTLLDLPAAESTPDGYGHLYSIRANVQSWAAVTDAAGWTSADTETLTALMEERRAVRKSLIDQLGD